MILGHRNNDNKRVVSIRNHLKNSRGCCSADKTFAINSARVRTQVVIQCHWSDNAVLLNSLQIEREIYLFQSDNTYIIIPIIIKSFGVLICHSVQLSDISHRDI